MAHGRTGLALSCGPARPVLQLQGRTMQGQRRCRGKRPALHSTRRCKPPSGLTRCIVTHSTTHRRHTGRGALIMNSKQTTPPDGNEAGRLFG